MSLAAWSPDDSSLIRKSQQVYTEIIRIQDQNRKVQNLGAVTVRGRIKSDKEKLDELYSSGLFSGGNATIFDLMHDGGAYASGCFQLPAKPGGRPSDQQQRPDSFLKLAGIKTRYLPQ